MLAIFSAFIFNKTIFCDEMLQLWIKINFFILSKIPINFDASTEIWQQNFCMELKMDNFSAPCTKKVALTAIPVNRNFVFGKDDIDEMLFMLQVSKNFESVKLKD